jgi:hypothetical protein
MSANLVFRFQPLPEILAIDFDVGRIGRGEVIEEARVHAVAARGAVPGAVSLVVGRIVIGGAAAVRAEIAGRCLYAPAIFGAVFGARR